MALADEVIETRFVASDATPRDLAHAVVVDRLRNGTQWLRRCFVFFCMFGLGWIVSPVGVSAQRRVVASAGIGLFVVTVGAVFELTSLHRKVRRSAERDMPDGFEVTARFGQSDYTIHTATKETAHPYHAVTHVTVRPTYVAVATWRPKAIAAIPLPRALFPDAALDRLLRGMGGHMPAVGETGMPSVTAQPAVDDLVDAYDHVFVAERDTASKVARAHLRSPTPLIVLQALGTSIFVVELLVLGRRFTGVASVIVSLLLAVFGTAVLWALGLAGATRNMRTDLFEGARLGTRFDEESFVAMTPTQTLRKSYGDVRSIEPRGDLVTMQFHGGRGRVILPRALVPDDAVERVRRLAGIDASGRRGGRRRRTEGRTEHAGPR